MAAQKKKNVTQRRIKFFFIKRNMMPIQESAPFCDANWMGPKRKGELR